MYGSGTWNYRKVIKVPIKRACMSFSSNGTWRLMLLNQLCSNLVLSGLLDHTLIKQLLVGVYVFL